MCGVVGTVTLLGAENTHDLAASLAMLCRRGPDAHGVLGLVAGRSAIHLGHTRLSIIDLSHEADQPMTSADGQLVITFNGEIYNYLELREELRSHGCVFRTASDTEVLLNAWSVWGSDCLRRLRGMFAFAIVDLRQRRLTVARDVFGIKPLYLHSMPNAAVFASEVPALLSAAGAPGRVDEESVAGYLMLGQYDQNERTFIHGVTSLPPGHLGELDLAAGSFEFHTKRWWWPSIEPLPNVTLPEAADTVRGLFLKSVGIHLRSDVPIGFALSGGLDSSAVVCGARLLEPDLEIHTFTYAAENPRMNEEHYAAVIARHVGAHSHVVSTDADALCTDLDDLVMAQGEPFGSTSIYAQYGVFREAAAAGIKVVLEGQGADELLGGYHGYPGHRIRSLIERHKFREAVGFVRASSEWPGRSVSGHVRNTLSVFAPPRLQLVFHRLANHRPPDDWLRGPGLLRRDMHSTMVAGSNGRRLSAELRRQLTGKGDLTALLRHADRNSMRFSIESRVPFLDVDLAEYLLRLPEEYLVSRAGETKHVFRLAMEGIVPEQILQRRDKIGFATPENQWVRTMLTDPDFEGSIARLPWVNHGSIVRDLRKHLDSDEGSDFRWWRLLNLLHWVRLLEDSGLVRT